MSSTLRTAINLALVGAAIAFAVVPRAGAHLDHSLITGNDYWLEQPNVYYDNACSAGGSNQFVRNCWHNWQHSSSPLDCHDQDGTSFISEIKSWNSGTVGLQGHSLW